MFAHVFFYRLKCLARDKERVFWTLLFPLLLATLFQFAFGHLTSAEEGFSPIKTAVIDSSSYRQNSNLRKTLQAMSAQGESQVLALTVTTSAEAHRLLESGEVVGIISIEKADVLEDGEDVFQASKFSEPAKPVLDPKPRPEPVPEPRLELIIKEKGLEQSMLKMILDEYMRVSKAVSEILKYGSEKTTENISGNSPKNNPVALQELMKSIQNRKSYTARISFSDALPDTMLSYFYALISMACMYSSFWGLRNALDIQGDLSTQGLRRIVAPTHKLKVVLADALAALTLSFGEILILLAYLVFALGIDFGNQFAYVILTCLAGCFAGVSLGTFIGIVGPRSEGAKLGIVLGLSMVMSFLAGLMFVDMKYIVAKRFPFLSYINPVALISDAFYSLYVFRTHGRFLTNIILLFAMSLSFCTVAYVRLKRERYASV